MTHGIDCICTACILACRERGSDRMHLKPENLKEYDAAARWCAVRKHFSIGCPLPEALSSAVHEEINAHPDEFLAHVRAHAYALAMGEVWTEEEALADPAGLVDSMEEM